MLASARERSHTGVQGCRSPQPWVEARGGGDAHGSGSEDSFTEDFVPKEGFGDVPALSLPIPQDAAYSPVCNHAALTAAHAPCHASAMPHPWQRKSEFRCQDMTPRHVHASDKTPSACQLIACIVWASTPSVLQAGLQPRAIDQSVQLLAMQSHGDSARESLGAPGSDGGSEHSEGGGTGTLRAQSSKKRSSLKKFMSKMKRSSSKSAEGSGTVTVPSPAPAPGGNSMSFLRRHASREGRPANDS
jgi:hypothetical protein